MNSQLQSLKDNDKTPVKPLKRNVQSPQSLGSDSKLKKFKKSSATPFSDTRNDSDVTWDTSPLLAERLKKTLLATKTTKVTTAKELDDVSALFGKTASRSALSPLKHWHSSLNASKTEHRQKTHFKKSSSYHGLQSPRLVVHEKDVDPIEKLWQQTLQQHGSKRSMLLHNLPGRSVREYLSKLRDSGSANVEWDESSLCEAVERFERLLASENEPLPHLKTPTRPVCRSASESILVGLSAAAAPSSDGFDFDDGAFEHMLQDPCADAVLGKLLDNAPMSDSASLDLSNDETDAFLNPHIIDLLNKASKEAEPKRYNFRYIRAQIVSADTKGECKEISITRTLADGTSEGATVRLYGSWIDTPTEPGAFFNIIDPSPVEIKSKRYVIGDGQSQAMLILHPDLLFTGTLLSESVNCTRKAYLDSRVRGPPLLSESIEYGNMIHELLQSALLASDFSDKFLLQKISSIVHDYVINLWAVGLRESQVEKMLLEQVPSLQAFAATYLGDEPRDTATLVEHRGGERHNYKVALRAVKSVEQAIWSPVFGVKGKVDVTVEAALVSEKDGKAINLVPLEIKTGRQRGLVSHRAQTVLYTLLLKDCYKIQPNLGLLYYQKTGELLEVPVIQHELQSIMQARNRLAHYTSKSTLPPMLGNRHHCARCFSRKTCFLYHAGVENGDFESAGVSVEEFNEAAGHLQPRHALFLKKWDWLLALEEKTLGQYKEEIWLLTSKQREQLHRCLGRMIVVPTMHTDAIRFGRQSTLHLLTLARADKAYSESLLQSNLIPGDPIIISSETGRVGISIGFVAYVYADRILVRVDNNLTPDPMPCPSQFSPNKRHIFIESSDVAQTEFRIDKDELGTEMFAMRGNLVQLCSGVQKEGKTVPSKLCRLLVDLEPPKFAPLNPQEHCLDASIVQKLNSDQKKALEMMLCAQDYLLVLGMPGTGKTTAIAAMIETLLGLGKTVLLTAYTHSAVDNVLLKVLQEAPDVPFVRLGQVSKLHPAIAPHSPENMADLDSVEKVEQFFQSRRLVGTTALGLRHPLLLKRRFDYVIVDEASQLTLPVCLGPLLLGDRFVLVGDHYQLPPLVRQEQARAEGLQNSLFKQLCEAHVSAVASLTFQYRMNQSIMKLSNTLVYGNRLHCGSEKVAQQTLNIPHMWPDAVHGGWLPDVLDPSRPVLFIDTANVPALETRTGHIVNNVTEARLVYLLVSGLLSSGVAAHDIGVITPYRAQLRLLHGFFEGFPLLELNTVDKYQGRDKLCIVVSFVRSNADRLVGELLNDWRRLNVAFTRAKAKLLLVGSSETLASSPLLAQFLKLLESQGWMYRDLTAGADSHYPKLWKLHRKLKASEHAVASPNFFQRSVRDVDSTLASTLATSDIENCATPTLHMLSSSPTRFNNSSPIKQAKRAKQKMAKVLANSPSARLLVESRLEDL